jgi:hypothetical protein
VLIAGSWFRTRTVRCVAFLFLRVVEVIFFSSSRVVVLFIYNVADRFHVITLDWLKLSQEKI